jgi:hypothetical protein
MHHRVPSSMAISVHVDHTKLPSWAEQYAMDTRDLLGLGDWTIALKAVDHPGREDGTDGVCYLDARYLSATIEIRRNLGEARMRAVIMHELLHLVLGPIDTAFDRLTDLLGDGLQGHAQELYTDALEGVIVRLTAALQRGVTAPTQQPDREA